MAERLALFLVQTQLYLQLLVDLLEILLPCFDEVLLLCPRSIRFLHLLTTVVGIRSYLIPILKQIHLKLVLALQKIF